MQNKATAVHPLGRRDRVVMWLTEESHGKGREIEKINKSAVKKKTWWGFIISSLLIEGNDGEDESEEDEDYVPSEDWKKVME